MLKVYDAPQLDWIKMAAATAVHGFATHPIDPLVAEWVKWLCLVDVNQQKTEIDCYVEEPNSTGYT